MVSSQDDHFQDDRCNVLLVYPRFNANTFWNYQATCEMVGARYPGPPLGLVTVAAMLPQHWSFKLVNGNTEELADADLEWADMVLTGGMINQQWDTLAILRRAHAFGKPVVVGGPGISSMPEPYAAAEFKILGECELVIDDFVADWRAGKRAGTYEPELFKADVTKTPCPRWDLLKFDQYMHIGLQFSRGCPFTCEFCDIIELYGRVPRTKTTPQVLFELQRLYDLGYRGHVDFVDDNLIGNKKAVKAFLPHLIAWQKERDFPFEFSTEASINLSDDSELLGLMRDANFFAVFIGIESPDSDALIAMSKKQNTRRKIADSVRKLYEHGIFVIAGFIVGFDTETGSIAEPMAQLIEEAAIPVATIGLLFATPKTQLTKRLHKEGRLFEWAVTEEEGEVCGDQCTGGLNFVTKRPRTEALADYKAVLERVYSPQAYFARVRDVAGSLEMAKRTPRAVFDSLRRDSIRFLRLVWKITATRPDMRGEMWRTLLFMLRKNPLAITSAMRLTALYVHLGPFSRYVISKIDEQIEAIESGRWVQPALIPPPVPPARQVAELVA